MYRAAFNLPMRIDGLICPMRECGKMTAWRRT